MKKKKVDPEVSRLIAAARWVLEDALDREETRDEDGEEYEDYCALRKALIPFGVKL